MKKNSKTQNRGPGRPMYSPKFPRSLKWTMRAFCEANGVDPDTGKGEACSKLTLIKYLGRKQGKAMVKQIPGETTEPSSKSGLGRKAFLFCLRTRYDEVKAIKDAAKAKAAAASTKTVKTVKATRSPRKVKTVTVNVGTSTADYEAQKAALLTPAVDIAPAPAPAAEVAPEVPAETPAAAAAAAEPVAPPQVTLADVVGVEKATEAVTA